MSDPELVGVKATNQLTLVMELERPTAYFLHLLARALYPVPRHIVDTHGEAWTEIEHLVTNGPFRLLARQPEQAMTLERNPAYHGQFTGNLQQVELHFLSDWPARVDMYQADKLDVMNLSLVPPAERDQIRRRYAGEYVSVPQLGTHYVAFDVGRPPFDDQRVRRAFVLATDREMLANVTLKGQAAPATGGFLPPEMPGHSSEISLPYDPQQAQQLLAEAGYPNEARQGFPVIKALVPNTQILISEQLQKQWRENLGVETEIEIIEWAELDERMNNKPPALSVIGWGADYPDPDNFLKPGVIEYGTRWRNEAYDQLIETARQLLDQELRIELYRQADRMLVEEAPVLPLAYGRLGLLLKPWVKSYPTSPLAIYAWFGKEIVIEPHMDF
jgi:oligopeptide transport system substrate-binding protein